MFKHIIGIHPLKSIATLTLALSLCACGGGDDNDSLLDQINNSSSSAGGGSNSSSSGGSNSSQANTIDIQELGFGSGDNFQAGVIGVGIGTGALSAGGTTTLTVNIVSGTGDLVTESVTVAFNSRCVAAGTSELQSASGAAIATVITTNGEASVVYKAKGCVGDDRITASASYEGNSLSATSTINVESDLVQTITFESASNDRISLRGTGSGETSVLTFQVLGSAGAPMQNVDVNFSLNNSAGGASLTTTTARTGNNGIASTTIQAGTIAATVRVTAKAVGTEVSTQSDPILISTGIPDQKSMTLSPEKFNPDTWQVNNIPVEITVQLADAFSNPPPEGTAVTFTTSGGSISPGCTTDATGVCKATWRSGNPRPSNGRITIMAHTPGNESFIDVNGNGWYDDAIDKFVSGTSECLKNVPFSSASEEVDVCDDLGDAYLDKNYNYVFDNNDTFIDFDPVKSPGYSAGNGKYNGALCPIPEGAAEGETEGVNCSTTGVTIREDIVLVMSCHDPILNEDGLLPGQPANISLLGGSASITLTLADCNGNSLPADTAVSVNIENADNIKVSRPSVIITNDKIGPSTYSLTLNVDNPDDPASGAFTFEIAVPGRAVIATEQTIID